MARIRTIKPEFFTSEKVAALTDSAKLTFIGLWTEADDYGVLQDNSKIIKGHLWPLDDSKNAVDMSLHVQEMLDQGLVRRFEADGNRWLQITGFRENQTINRPSKKRNPSPPWAADEGSRSPHGALTEEPVRVEPGTLKGDGKQLTEGSRSPHGGLTDGSGSGSGSGKGSGKGSGSGVAGNLPNPFANAANGHATTTTSDDANDRAFRAVAVGLARQYARDGEEAAYRARILAKPEDHMPGIEKLSTAHPELDPDDIAVMYLDSRKKQPPPKPRCGICHGDAHPNGPIDCPEI